MSIHFTFDVDEFNNFLKKHLISVQSAAALFWLNIVEITTKHRRNVSILENDHREQLESIDILQKYYKGC